MRKKMLKIGASEEIITPKTGIELCGFLARTQPSVGHYDDLYAKVLYAENNGNKILWIHCDLIGFSNDLADSIRESSANLAQINVKNVLISATHTHSGPATVHLRKCGNIDADYIDFLKKTIAEGVTNTIHNLEEVEPCFTETTLDGVAIDRRKSSENSHVDNKMPILAFRRNDASFKAVIANYGIHNVGLSADNRKISGDIAGFAAKQASATINGNPIVFMTNGGCGNINPAEVANGYSAVEKIGAILGNKIKDEMPNLQAFSNCEISSSFSSLELPLEALDCRRLDEIMSKHRQYCESLEDNYVNNRLYEALNIWHDETKKLIEINDIQKSARAYIHILKLGPIVFAGINAEVFSIMAEQLRNETNLEHIYTLGYADGCLGYLAPEYIYNEGGYEVDDAHKFYGHFRLNKGCFELVKEKAVVNIKAIFKKK
jgi:hypothetical protein